MTKIIFDTGADGHPQLMLNGRTVRSVTRVSLEWEQGVGVTVAAEARSYEDQGLLDELLLADGEIELFIHGDVEITEASTFAGVDEGGYADVGDDD